ncbi:MAG: glycoside hydrolase family 3 [Oscillibacter sp.]|nr:glycoside hydrolase family 3 [Oscillibacter sp.]
MPDENKPVRNRFRVSELLSKVRVTAALTEVRRNAGNKSYRIAALVCLAVLLMALSGLGTAETYNAAQAFPPDAEGVLTVQELQELAAAQASDVDADAAQAETVDADTANIEPESASGVTPEQAANVGTEPAPVIEPEPAPVSKAEKLLSEMSLREKALQLFIVFPEQLTGQTSSVTAAGDALRDGLQRYPVGGVLFDRGNMKSREQLLTLLNAMQSYSKIPLLTTCDEEGGRVNRLMGAVGTPYVGPMLSYRDKGADTAKQNAVTIAGGLTSCGFNMDFAPVADVWSNPDNKVIGNRAYSTDYAEAAELVRAAVEGFHEGGVACTLKHFPGHGDTYEDSHNGLARVYRTWKQLETAELKPFRAGIAAGADAVMVGHLIVGEIDPQPATVSHVIVTDMLRNELEFAGVIITDSLQMDAVTKHYGAGEVALLALEAGVDILLAPDNLSAAAQAVISATEDGRLTEARLDESVLRVLNLKESYGLLP